MIITYKVFPGITKTYLYNFDLDEAVLTSTYNICFEQKCEKYQYFYLKIFIVLVVKFSVYLNQPTTPIGKGSVQNVEIGESTRHK